MTDTNAPAAPEPPVPPTASDPMVTQPLGAPVPPAPAAPPVTAAPAYAAAAPVPAGAYGPVGVAPSARPSNNHALAIVAGVVGGLVVLGLTFGGGVLVGRASTHWGGESSRFDDRRFDMHDRLNNGYGMMGGNGWGYNNQRGGSDNGQSAPGSPSGLPTGSGSSSSN